MNESSTKEKPYLMIVKPLKKKGRFRDEIKYDFETTNPKQKSHDNLNLPMLNFGSPQWEPAFITPHEKICMERNAQIYQEHQKKRLNRGKEEELKLLLQPRPAKATTCAICSQMFDDYYAHISSEFHKANFEKSQYLDEAFAEAFEIQNKIFEPLLQSLGSTSRDIDPPEEPVMTTIPDLIKTSKVQKYETSAILPSQKYKSETTNNSSKENYTFRHTNADHLQENNKATKKKKISTSKKKAVRPLNQVLSTQTTLTLDSKCLTDVTSKNPDLERGNSEKEDIKIQLDFPKQEGEKSKYNNSEDSETLRDKKSTRNPSEASENEEEKKECLLPNDPDLVVQVRAKPQYDIQEEIIKTNNKKTHSDRYCDQEDELVNGFKRVKITDNNMIEVAEEQNIPILLSSSSFQEKWKGMKSKFLGILDDFKSKLSEIWKHK
jgi:AAA ATPase containing von Willebrand factor type A (vWA) domain